MVTHQPKDGYPIWPCLALFDTIWPGLPMFGPVWPRSGTARIVLNCVELNIFMIWDGCTLNHFVIYYFDEKYQCLLISYKLILFQQKHKQQQPVIDFKNGVIVKIYKS